MKKLFIYSLFLFSFLLVSCVEDPTLNITGSDITVSGKGQIDTFTVYTNKPWTITSDQSWCSISPESGGKGQHTITITAVPNDTYASRKAKVTVTSDILTQSFTVTQSENYGINTDLDLYNISSDKQFLTIAVQSNTYYAVTTSETWIGRVFSKALTTDSLFFSVAQNTDSEGRSATITFTDTDKGIEETVTVNQSGFPAPEYLNETACGIYDTDSTDFSYIYTPFRDQYATVISSDNSKLSFRVISPKDNIFYSLNNIEISKIVEDQDFDVTISHNCIPEAEETFVLPVTVLKTTASTAWLFNYENGIGFIIYK